MIADVRRAVAVASYVMVTNRVASSVFDFTNGGYHLMSVSDRKSTRLNSSHTS